MEDKVLFVYFYPRDEVIVVVASYKITGCPSSQTQIGGLVALDGQLFLR